VDNGQQDDSTGTYGFPVVRRGYDRTAVDAFARQANTENRELRRQYETLAAHCARLEAEREATPAVAAEADYAGLGGRAQEILRIAEEQALDLTSRATADADRLAEQTEHEVQMLRDHAAAELEEIRRTELARIGTLRGQAEREAASLVGSASAEAEQLLQAARLAAAAVRAEAEGKARATVESAQLQAGTLLADAERDALTIRQQAAADRDRVLAELTAESDDLRGRIEQTLAESTALHRRSAEQLAAESAEASRLRAEALAEVERIRQAAVAEADELVGTARRQAATVEERSRQEFAWRRRQLRQEQELLTRRKQAMLSQLTSLSALAVETAESLPEVPELALSEEPAERDQPEPSEASGQPGHLEESGDQAQNSRSSALSMPRSTS
jgi:cell division septum initiation protein DivIVA